MALYTLYQDGEDLHTIVRKDLGWPGALWSSSLFAVDCWRLAAGVKTELDRATRAWKDRLWLPEPIAFWYARTGGLLVREPECGFFAERYLGLTYDPNRWADLCPSAFAVAVQAAASCDLTMETAARALLSATPEQLAGLSDNRVQAFPSHHHAGRQSPPAPRPQIDLSTQTSKRKTRPARK
jgi:hypothetical protein